MKTGTFQNQTWQLARKIASSSSKLSINIETCAAQLESSRQKNIRIDRKM
jgi:hypothetical protein